MYNYLNKDNYTEHSTLMDISSKAKSMDYQVNHRLLAEGNFVLSVNEGFNAGVHTSFYDLFRLREGKIIEHWDTTETVLPENKWKNNNGKF